MTEVEFLVFGRRQTLHCCLKHGKITKFRWGVRVGTRIVLGAHTSVFQSEGKIERIEFSVASIYSS